MMTFLKIPRVNPVDKFQLPSEAAATDKHHLVPNSPYHLYVSLIILQHLVTSPSSKQLWVCFPYFGAAHPASDTLPGHADHGDLSQRQSGLRQTSELG